MEVMYKADANVTEQEQTRKKTKKKERIEGEKMSQKCKSECCIYILIYLLLERDHGCLWCSANRMGFHKRKGVGQITIDSTWIFLLVCIESWQFHYTFFWDEQTRDLSGLLLRFRLNQTHQKIKCCWNSCFSSVLKTIQNFDFCVFT